VNKVFSAAITGLEAELIEVEADLTTGLKYFSIVGLPDKLPKEAIFPIINVKINW